MLFIFILFCLFFILSYMLNECHVLFLCFPLISLIVIVFCFFVFFSRKFNLIILSYTCFISSFLQFFQFSYVHFDHTLLLTLYSFFIFKFMLFVVFNFILSLVVLFYSFLFSSIVCRPSQCGTNLRCCFSSC